MILTRCTACTMPSTRPDLEFVDGVCSGCINYAKRTEVNWAERKRDLVRLLERSPAKNGYDCIVASSGGKDSTYQVLTLIELGAKPLVVTAQTCMLTEVGRRNIDNLSRFADTQVVNYDPGVRSRLNVLGHELVGDLSWPEHVAVFSAPFRVAAKGGPNLIFYGECPNTEYSGPLDSATDRMTKRWIAEFGGHLGLRPSDMVGQLGLTAADMEPFQLPSDEQMDRIDARFLGAFIPWDSHRNAEIAIANGMHAPDAPPCPANWWNHENLDNAQTGLHDFLGYVKFGYGRLCAQLSIDIRYGRITRAEALELVRQRDGLFPYVYMGVGVDEALAHIGKNLDWFMRTVDKFMNKELFCRVENHRPILHEFDRLEAAA